MGGAVQQVRTIKDIQQLGTILGVWAHPDDESFTCAGIMAAAINNGQNVICITATKGEAGVQDASRWPPELLGEIRAAEIQAALQVVGVTNHHWLGYHDGVCKQVSTEEAVSRVKQLIDRYQPDTILTFGPDGLTGHPDHQTVSAWAHAAAKGRGIAIYHAVQPQAIYDKYLKAVNEQFDIFFNTDEPPLRDEEQCDICFKLPPYILEQKYQALQAMLSQTEAMLKSTPKQQILESFGCECFEVAS